MQPCGRMKGRARAPSLACVGLVLLGCSAGACADSVLVLEFEMNDLTLYPTVEQEQARVDSLRPLLAEALEAHSGHATPLPPPAAAVESTKGQGYVFDRPAVAARLGHEVDADWVVSGRLHKASHLFVYLKAQLIDVGSAQVVSDFVVELKGWGEKLTRRGVDALALQIDSAIEQLEQSAE